MSRVAVSPRRSTRLGDAVSYVVALIRAAARGRRQSVYLPKFTRMVLYVIRCMEAGRTPPGSLRELDAAVTAEKMAGRVYPNSDYVRAVAAYATRLPGVHVKKYGRGRRRFLVIEK